MLLVSVGSEIQGWCVSSQTEIVGAGKFGSAKLPIATATIPGKASLSKIDSRAADRIEIAS
jgi:hypothetical protein